MKLLILKKMIQQMEMKMMMIYKYFLLLMIPFLYNFLLKDENLNNK